ncbi:hypothetical protein HCH52_04115 [Oscillospiraceae bacterium HV4-5-C5C]|nr:hypothetical protein [Oscillospiraceae bacterium HV4-5-C5C]
MIKQFCPYCRVSVRGQKSRCPLCGHAFAPSDLVSGQQAEPAAPAATAAPAQSPEPADLWPKIPEHYNRHILLRALVFISVAAIILAFAIFRLFPAPINWPWFVLLGVASMWLDVSNILLKRRNPVKVISWQLSIILLLGLLWDWGTDWHGWSLSYVLPISCSAAMLALYIIAKVQHMQVQDYLVYLLICAAAGLLPLLFMLLGLVHPVLPSLISVVISLILIAAAFIFYWEEFRDEWRKRFHL